jgi:hypothetical protein
MSLDAKEACVQNMVPDIEIAEQMQSLLADWFRAIYRGRMHICNQPIREQRKQHSVTSSTLHHYFC